MHKHFVLFKPDGYLSQFIYEQKRKKKLLGELYDFPEGTMAVGRLDEASEGLLILTTNGVLSEQIRSNKFEKEYWVQVDGLADQEAVDKLKSGVEIGIEGVRYITKPCQAELISTPENLPKRNKSIRDERHGPTSWMKITIKEGKYRQVRKMTATVGFPTLRLMRVRIGMLNLGSLNPGDVREISVEEIGP